MFSIQDEKTSLCAIIDIGETVWILGGELATNETLILRITHGKLLGLFDFLTYKHVRRNNYCQVRMHGREY